MSADSVKNNDLPDKSHSSSSSQDLDPELLRQFEDWRHGAKPLSPDVIRNAATQPPPEKLPVDPLHRASRIRAVRQVVLVAILLFGSLSLYFTRQEIAYFFSDSTPYDLGNLRNHYHSGKRSLEVESNTYVRAEGLVMMEIAQAGRFQYFFCPLYNIIVRTERELPEKARADLTYIELEPEWLPILENRLALPSDLTAGFEATGQLLRLTDGPRWVKEVRKFYDAELTVPPDQAFLLLDGEAPGDKLWYVFAIGIFILLAGSSGWLYARARRVERELFEDRVAMAKTDPRDGR
ncbi:MAG: hypothetical protein HUU55_04880 [Myxococcales bacterium]|nr:hypothetical protein [Myxococcales bacterium]